MITLLNLLVATVLISFYFVYRKHQKVKNNPSEFLAKVLDIVSNSTKFNHDNGRLYSLFKKDGNFIVSYNHILNNNLEIYDKKNNKTINLDTLMSSYERWYAKKEIRKQYMNLQRNYNLVRFSAIQEC